MRMNADRLYLVRPGEIQVAMRWFEGLLERALQAGPVLVGVGREKRSNDQSAKFHAMCGDIARQVQWMGDYRTKDQWKVLLVSGHAIATGLGAKVVPGLEGEFVNIRESTASMPKSRMSSLIEYTYAFGAGEGVEWSELAKKEAA